jgi:hypothetical protein
LSGTLANTGFVRMRYLAWKRTARAISIAGAFVLSLLVGGAASTAAGQAPTAQPPPAGAPTAAPPAAAPDPTPTPAAPAPTGAEGYRYQPDGRRDPFLSLQGRAGEIPSPMTRPSGLPGSLISEVSVKGVVRNLGRLVAVLQGADNKTYLVHGNERLYDGAVKEVFPDAVVFVQDVNDPLSLVKQREVRKPLRPMEEEK